MMTERFLLGFQYFWMSYAFMKSLCFQSNQKHNFGGILNSFKKILEKSIQNTLQ